MPSKPRQSRLRIAPCSFAEACDFIGRNHRHHLPPVGHKYSIGVLDNHMELRAVACIGRPVSRHLDDKFTAEVTRVASDGCPNACSALYGAAWRSAKGMGYTRMVTYTLASEPGTSLKAAGWIQTGRSRGGTWSCESRPRVDKHPLEEKIRWEPKDSVKVTDPPDDQFPSPFDAPIEDEIGIFGGEYASA